LGYGGGLLRQIPAAAEKRPLTVGAVMDELLLDEVPVGVYDVKTKVVVTQSRCCFTGGDQWE
jgi:5-formyltetrahydrofolate cyclo-ligase